MFTNDILGLDAPEAESDRVWVARRPTSVAAVDSGVVIEVPFELHKSSGNCLYPQGQRVSRRLRITGYGGVVIRATLELGPGVPDDQNVMLEMHESLCPEALHVESRGQEWCVVDSNGKSRMRISRGVAPTRPWRDASAPEGNIGTLEDPFEVTVFPDGEVMVPFATFDMFYPAWPDSLPLAYIERDSMPIKTAFSLRAMPDDKFAGTGERFAGMNLSGRTMLLENVDASGVNSERCYKNVPFYVCSRPYGMLVMTSAHVLLSLAGFSTRAAQGLIEDGSLDMFFMGGGSLERILYNYRRLTGFPRAVPLWSYGSWMSRNTYFSADEVREVGKCMREEELPCDVIHLDTGWFEEDWKCDWEFSRERFPDPEALMQEMRENGFRVSLWQLPWLHECTRHYETARINGYIPRRADGSPSNFELCGGRGANIDLSNPKAVEWYQDLLEKPLRLGASAIKADFGESIDLDAEYCGGSGRMLHNLYALLYQKAVWETTERVTGEGLIWARSSWVGSQRYPVHWAGDGACSWDGMAGTLRGGLHLGMSGFAFWSHDVPGFHGVPDFVSSWPSDDIYVRWTQLGVFTSHLRYHGTQPREPYEYPEIKDIVAWWLRLRYALIPYLWDQGQKAVATGYPVLRAMVLHHESDRLCWCIDDQFYCGESLLVAPVLNSDGVRDIYLPEGRWVDFWTGEKFSGPLTLRNTEWPLSRMPVYAVEGSAIRVYPHPVQCTDAMNLADVTEIRFDGSYSGLANSVLSGVLDAKASPSRVG